MRIRTVKPEFWSHPVLSREPDSVRLAALGVLNMADDEGYFLADPALVRSSLWPLTESSVSTHGALTRLSQLGWIEVRKHCTHGMIGMVVNFRKHQVINRPTPSKLKTYFLTESSVSTHGALTESSLPEQGREGNREQGTETPPLPSAKRKRKPGNYTEDFETFWKAYPNRKAKVKAFEAWERSTDKPSLAEILTSIESQKKSHEWTKDAGQFIPHPATWINQGRWDDQNIAITPLPVRKNYI